MKSLLAKIKIFKNNINIVDHAWRMKWDWTDHMFRMSDNRWTKILFNWYLKEERKRGKQKTRWADDMVEFLDNNIFHRVAQNRREWPRLKKSFAQAMGLWCNVIELKIVKYSVAHIYFHIKYSFTLLYYYEGKEQTSRYAWYLLTTYPLTRHWLEALWTEDWSATYYLLSWWGKYKCGSGVRSYSVAKKLIRKLNPFKNRREQDAQKTEDIIWTIQQK